MLHIHKAGKGKIWQGNQTVRLSGVVLHPFKFQETWLLCAGLFVCHVSGHVCSSRPLAVAATHRTQHILCSKGKASLLCGVVLFLSSVTKAPHYWGGGAEVIEESSVLRQTDLRLCLSWPWLLPPQGSNSSPKADSAQVISERAKEQNYRLSGKGWRIRPLERERKMNPVEE